MKVAPTGANFIANNVDIGDVFGTREDWAMPFIDVEALELDAYHMDGPLGSQLSWQRAPRCR